MDAKSKKINISNNMLVGLKAELLRKQDHKKPVPERVISRFHAKNEVPFEKGTKTKSTRKVKRNDLSAEEIQELEKSKKILEKKSKIYDQMNEDVLSMDDSSKLPFLVDFEQKAIDNARDKRAGPRPRMSESDSDSDGEWVDYVDGLGRSRRCLKKDLLHFKEMDKNLISSMPPKPESTSAEPHLLSDDMRREIERQKWEEEVKELSTKENIHYSDVTFSEIRDHGVGFFNFAKDEQTRTKQMELLKQLREQTKTQRKIFSSAKEKKRKMLEIRLAKIMQRKVVQEAIKKSGLDPHTLIAGMKEEEYADEAKSDDEEGLIGSEVPGSQASDDENVELLKRDDSWRKEAPIREWDVGKKVGFDEDTWLNQRREERNFEFAPVYQDSVISSSKTQESHNSSEGDTEDIVALNLKKLRMLIS